MAQERVDIVIDDKVAPTIAPKIDAMAAAAFSAHSQVVALQKATLLLAQSLNQVARASRNAAAALHAYSGGAASASATSATATATANAAKAAYDASKASTALVVSMTRELTVFESANAIIPRNVGVLTGYTNAVMVATAAQNSLVASTKRVYGEWRSLGIHIPTQQMMLSGGQLALPPAHNYGYPAAGGPGRAVRGGGGTNAMLGYGGTGTPAAPTSPGGYDGMGGAGRAVRGGGNSAQALGGMYGKSSSAVKNLTQNMNTARKSSIGLGSALRTMFMTYFAIAAAQRIMSIADSYQQMANKLKVVTGSADAAEGELDRLAQIANESRTSLDATVTLYQRLALAMSNTSATGQDVENVVRNVNKAMILGGAATQEATAAVRQLSQAFNKGKADGDEFRSMMENAPILMDMVAREMGVARTELLAMAEQGKITSEVMFNAFSKGVDGATDMSSQVLTVSQATTQLNNNLIIEWGHINKLLKITQNLAKAVHVVAKNTDILVASMVVLLTVVTVAKLGALTQAFINLGIAIKTAFTGGGTLGLVIIVLSVLGSAAYVIYERMQAVNDQAAELIKNITGEGAKRTPFDDKVDELRRLFAVYNNLNGKLDENMEIMQLEQEMQKQGLSLTAQQVDAMHNLLSVVRWYQIQAETIQDVYDGNAGAMNDLRAELEALTKAYELGYMSAEQYRLGQFEVRADLQRTAVGMLDTSTISGKLKYAWESLRLGALQLGAEIGPVFQGMADTVTDALKRMSDGVGELVAQWAVFGEKMRFIDVFRQVIAQMIQQLVALATQYMIVGVMRQFAMGGMTLAPSIPSSGFAPGFSSSQGQPQKGFYNGGYTGGYDKQHVAGVVHGKEFVVNARATAQNRSTLEAMNAGKSVVPNVTINNNAPGVTVRAEYVSHDEVRLICEETVSKRAGSAVARDMSNPNSAVSRSMRKNTTAGRKGV